jgi:hypothetical protein
MKRVALARKSLKSPASGPGPHGQEVTIGYRAWHQPALPMTEVDGLDLAGQSEQDWRDYLKKHGIPVPTV